MDDNEQLKLTDFTDPIVQLAVCMAFAGDLLFFLIPVKYILAVIIGFILWPGVKGFVAKTIFILCLFLPFTMTIGVILAAILSNSLMRAIVLETAAVALSESVVGGAVLHQAAMQSLQQAGEEKGGVVGGALKTAGTAGSFAGPGAGAGKAASASAKTAEAAGAAAGASAKVEGVAESKIAGKIEGQATGVAEEGVSKEWKIAEKPKKFEDKLSERQKSQLANKIGRTDQGNNNADINNTDNKEGDLEIDAISTTKVPESRPAEERVDLRNPRGNKKAA